MIMIIAKIFYVVKILLGESSLIRTTTYFTDAQEWHIVSLLGDVISPSTAVHYVSMTSDLRVLSTKKQ